MKKLLPILVLLLSFPRTVFAQSHQDRCGMQQMHETMIAKKPSLIKTLAEQRATLQFGADYYLQYKTQNKDDRTTSISAVPVIFHIVVDSAQFNSLGGTAGIIKRCDSQMEVLNNDYNMQNSDSSLIPSLWKSLYGNVGIHFGLAGKDPAGNCSPGYEVKIIPGSTLTDAGFSNGNGSFPEAKTASTGLAAWDVTKYLNVWCINFTGFYSSILGSTVSYSTVLLGFPPDEEGVCIKYSALGSVGPTGVPPAGTGSWPNHYNLGRTLTHEIGHFFEIWHPWGDDYGQCPVMSSDTTIGGRTCAAGIGLDDGLSDTPPQSDATYGNPPYTITGGTFNDCCMMHGTVNAQPIGIASLTFMDYTYDIGMHMFTTMQAAAMASMVLVPPTGGGGVTGFGSIGESYSLTQHPDLLIGCTSAVAPSPTEQNSSLSIYPNPNSGQLNISLNSAAEKLNGIIVFNLLGQQVFTLNGQGRDYYTIDLSEMSRGIYFVKCDFESGTVTRKILLQ